jgi:YidC/Oxa1 family membrane protein insertase
MKKPNILLYVTVFLLTYMVVQLFQGAPANPVLDEGPIGLETAKTEYAIGKDIRVTVQNNEADPLVITQVCEAREQGSFLLPAFTIMHYEDGAFTLVSDIQNLPECTSDLTVTIQPGEKHSFSLLSYSYSYFGEIGRYRLDLSSGETTVSSPEFQITKPGVLTMLWRTLIYVPLLNVLVAILIYLPGHSLGLAVILLTIVIRTILLIPSQKAMKAQRRMQMVQPKLEEIKKKYAGDQTRIAEETMKLWREAKVNPLSSCLPILIQLPILIALYYVIMGGLSPDRTTLIYNFLPEFSLHNIDPNFFGFNLLEHSLIVFPLTIGVLQFIQMQLMSYQRKNKKAQAAAEKAMPNEVEMANKMMKYVMPVMIAVFATQTPAAVGLYWGTSTFYGIIQQLVVNKEGPELAASPDDDVQVRVINRRQ